jgi:hypothetical protein
MSMAGWRWCSALTHALLLHLCADRGIEDKKGALRLLLYILITMQPRLQSVGGVEPNFHHLISMQMVWNHLIF